MFGSVQTSRYDLRFSLFGIPVHVTPLFWLAGLLTGWSSAAEHEYDLLAIWIGCLFVSILIHELGHALLAKWFGCPPEIYLYQFGGLAVFRPNYRFTTLRSVLVSLAGPGAGFVLYGAIYVLKERVLRSDWFFHLNPEAQTRFWFFLIQMEWINLFWGLVNLLPVLPLDGGRVAESLLSRLRRWDGHNVAIMLGIIVSGAVAFAFLARDDRYGAILFGILCISNVQMLQERRARPW